MDAGIIDNSFYAANENVALFQEKTRVVVQLFLVRPEVRLNAGKSLVFYPASLSFD